MTSIPNNKAASILWKMSILAVTQTRSRPCTTLFVANINSGTFCAMCLGLALHSLCFSCAMPVPPRQHRLSLHNDKPDFSVKKNTPSNIKEFAVDVSTTASECMRLACLVHSNRRCHSFHWISMNIPTSCTTGHSKRNNVMFYDFCLSLLEHISTLSQLTPLSRNQFVFFLHRRNSSNSVQRQLGRDWEKQRGSEQKLEKGERRNAKSESKCCSVIFLWPFHISSMDVHISLYLIWMYAQEYKIKYKCAIKHVVAIDCHTHLQSTHNT